MQLFKGLLGRDCYHDECPLRVLEHLASHQQSVLLTKNKHGKWELVLVSNESPDTAIHVTAKTPDDAILETSDRI